MKESCSTCRFFFAVGKVCRRYPPAVMVVGVKQSIVGGQQEPVFAASFPQLDPNLGWCGEHRDLDYFDA